MYRIERRDFGYKLTFRGYIERKEMQMWLEDSRKELENAVGGFGIFVDMRKLDLLPYESQKLMEEGQKLYRKMGMERSVVILNNFSTTLQFRRIAKETGIYDNERYIDAACNPDWEGLGIGWLRGAVEPSAGKAEKPVNRV